MESLDAPETERESRHQDATLKVPRAFAVVPRLNAAGHRGLCSRDEGGHDDPAPHGVTEYPRS